MATFAEIEDLRDWCEDALGEFLKRVELLNGEEPVAIMSDLQDAATCVNKHGIDVLKHLERLLVIKKKEEPLP